jgi:hypothetical protein
VGRHPAVAGGATGRWAELGWMGTEEYLQLTQHQGNEDSLSQGFHPCGKGRDDRLQLLLEREAS